MPLTLRPTALSSPAYRDWADYIVREGSRALGRIYEGRAPSLDEAKSQFLSSTAGPVMT
jgi:hypothetical protein